MRSAGNRILSVPSWALRSSHGLELAPLIALVIIGSIKSFYVCSTVDGLRSYSLAATSSIAGVTLPLFFLPFIPRVARFALLFLFNLALSLTLTMDLIHLQIATDVVSTASFQKIPLLPKVLWDWRSQLDPSFLLFFADCVLWAIWARSYITACRIIPPSPRRLAVRASLSLIVLGALAAYPSLQPIIRGGENMLAHTNVGRAVAARIGLLPYHVVDLLGYRRTTRLEHTASDIEEVRSVVTAGTMSPRSELFGVARGSNLILINAESLQSFPIGLRINGRELTPRFSAFAAESLNFVADGYLLDSGIGK